MKYFIILISFLFCEFANAQFNSNVYWTEQTAMAANDIIYFNLKKLLAWNDFKGIPVENSKAVAITSSGFGYKADIKNTGPVGQINIGVYCYFNKNTSWVKSGKNSDYILEHEQNHFNISFVAAKNFIEKLKSASFTRSNYNEILSRIYKESFYIMNTMQDDYDHQTKNGQDRNSQNLWNDFLSKKISGFTN